MPEENVQTPPADTSAQTPPSEGQQEQEKSPEVMAREAELQDISAMFADFTPKGEEENKDDKGSETQETEDGKKPEVKVPPEGGKEEQRTAPASKPGEEENKTEAKTGSSDELKNLLKDVLAEAGNKPKEEGKKDDKQEPPPPRYTPQIPDALIAAIEHEDPAVRRQGLNAMIGGAMSKVYEDVMKEAKAFVTEQLGRVPQIVTDQQKQVESARKAHDTFYSDNPNFAAPERGAKFKLLVAQVGMQLASKMQAEGTYKGWTPDFAKALAAEVQEMTGIAAGKPTTPAKKEPLATKAAKEGTGFQAGTGTRPADAGAKSLSDEIADVVLN